MTRRPKVLRLSSYLSAVSLGHLSTRMKERHVSLKQSVKTCSRKQLLLHPTSPQIEKAPVRSTGAIWACVTFCRLSSLRDIVLLEPCSLQNKKYPCGEGAPHLLTSFPILSSSFPVRTAQHYPHHPPSSIAPHPPPWEHTDRGQRHFTIAVPAYCHRHPVSCL